MARRYSEHEVEAAILASQHRRHDERMASDEWTLAESTDGLGGLVWHRVKEA